MSQKIKYDKIIITRAVISKIENETKPDTIKAKHVMGYNTPEKITQKENAKEYIPDIIATYEHGVNVYEIELDNKMPVDKWQLFSNYALNKMGKLILVVPEHMLDEFKRKLNDMDIKAQFIYFTTES